MRSKMLVRRRKARAAATAIANDESRFNKLMPVLKWMVGAILPGVVSLVMKAFF